MSTHIRDTPIRPGNYVVDKQDEGEREPVKKYKVLTIFQRMLDNGQFVEMLTLEPDDYEGPVETDNFEKVAAPCTQPTVKLKGTDWPVCPHCHHHNTGAWEWRLTEELNESRTCESCGKKFSVIMHVYRSFDTKKG